MRSLCSALLLALLSASTVYAYLPTREDLLAHCQSRRTTPDTIAVPYALLTSEGRQEVQLVITPDAWAWNYDPTSDNPTYEWHDGKRRESSDPDVRIKLPAPVRFDALFAQNKCDALLSSIERAGIDWQRATTLVHATERRSAVLYGQSDGNWVAFDRTSFRPVAAQWVVRNADLPEGAEAGSWWRILYELRYRDFRNSPDTVVITRELMPPLEGQPLSGLSLTGFVAPVVLTPVSAVDRAQLTLRRLDQPTRISDPRKAGARPRGRG